MSPDRPTVAPQRNGTVIFEQPLTERVRLYLRLEFLFAHYRHARSDDSEWAVRNALAVLLDILSLVARSDLKSEIIKELTAQHGVLTRLRERQGVDPERLGRVLDDISRALSAMQQLTTQATATGLRENEFLMMLANRSTVPGGTSHFDLPHFHCWLSQPSEVHRRDLAAWFADLAPFETAIGLYLNLLRESTEPTPQTATGGMFVHTPQIAFQLVRVLVPSTTSLYPEISAGRHRFTIRFMTLRDINTHAKQAAHDVPFDLQLCLL